MVMIITVVTIIAIMTMSTIRTVIIPAIVSSIVAVIMAFIMAPMIAVIIMTFLPAFMSLTAFAFHAFALHTFMPHTLAFHSLVFHAFMFAVLKFFMMRTIMRHVHIVVPAISYKVHRPSAGIISATVAAPVTGLFRADMQVDGRHIHMNAGWCNDKRFGKQQWRRRHAVDVNAAEKVGIANMDG